MIGDDISIPLLEHAGLNPDTVHAVTYRHEVGRPPTLTVEHIYIAKPYGEAVVFTTNEDYRWTRVRSNRWPAPTPNRSNAWAAPNDTDVIRRRYTGQNTTVPGRLVAEPPGVTNT